MTTDPFIEAARAEAERQNPVPTAYTSNGPSQWERLLAQEAFQNGAEWARTHLAAQEPTDAEVEAAADVLAESEDTGSVETARAALSAARAARRDEENR